MSIVSTTELQQFLCFIQAKIDAGEKHLPPEEVLELWRDENPAEEEFAESVRAIQVALDEMNAGDRGISADESVQKLRERIKARSA